MSFIFFVEASIPYTLNVHGKLDNLAGSPQVGTFNINFSIYNVSTGGNPLYTTTQSITTDSNGVYSTILQGVIPLDFEQQTFLGVTVESDTEMTPRINLTSVPSAIAGAEFIPTLEEVRTESPYIDGSIILNADDIGLTSNAFMNMSFKLGDNNGITSSRFLSSNGYDLVNIFSDGLVGIGDPTPEGILSILTSNPETDVIINNNASNGDPVLKFQLSGTTKMTIGIDDTGDAFEFNYGDGLSSSSEFSITSTTITSGDAKFTTGKLSSSLFCDTTPSVSKTNSYKLQQSNCDYTDFDFGTDNQELWLFCQRPNIGATIRILDGGDLILEGGADFQCVNEGDNILLRYKGGKWYDRGRIFV